MRRKTEDARLRVAVLGVSHWHLPNYLDPLTSIADVDVVGVSDPDPQVAERVASSMNTDWSADYTQLCDDVRPDFVFVLGKHSDMAATGEWLASNDFPFAMEKPCGLNGTEVDSLRQTVARHGTFAAVPFVWRQTDFAKALEKHLPNDTYEYLTLRIVSGFPDRYPQAGCAWVLDPAVSGGGSTINLSIHLIDLIRMLSGVDRPRLLSASMSNTSFGLPVEDWSMLVLDADGTRGVAETGLLFPAPTGTYDVHFSIKTNDHYVRTDFETTEILSADGSRVVESTPAANQPTYAHFVRDVIERYRAGVSPLTDMSDMATVMGTVDEAYRLAWPAVGAPAGRATPPAGAESMDA